MESSEPLTPVPNTGGHGFYAGPDTDHRNIFHCSDQSRQECDGENAKMNAIPQPCRFIICIRCQYSYIHHVRINRFCDLMVRVPGCRPRGPGLDSRRYQIFFVAVSLERGPFSLVRINEELLERKSNGSGLST
jgi:hypothetical protein